MPLMLKQSVVPLSVSEFMGNRKAIMREHGDIYAGTSDLVAYGGEDAPDEIKILLNVDNQGRITENGRKALELINPSQKRSSSGAIILTNELYDGFNGADVVTLSRKELERYGINERTVKGMDIMKVRCVMMVIDKV